MIPPDQEIFELEQRLVRRRADLARQARSVGERATQALASPLALLVAAALGFAAGGALAGRRHRPRHPERRRSDHVKAAKRTGFAGMLLPAVMWFVRAQWGSPVRAAQALVENFSKRKARASPGGDIPRA